MATPMETSPAGRSPPTVVAKVKALLMRAWRERWNDIQWGVQLKRVLTTNVGETKDLAELLLQQALVGTHPNSLIMSYIKHAVHSQIIPPTAAFRYIIDFDDLSRPLCILGLVDLAQDFTVNLSFTSVDSGLTLCKSLQGILHWLFLCMLKSLQKIQDGGPQEYINVLDAAGTAVQKITDSTTVRGLLYIARLEDTEMYRELEQTEVNVRGTMSQLLPDAIPQQIQQNVADTYKAFTRIQEVSLPNEPVLEVPHLPVCPTINTIVALEAVLNPTNEVQPFVEQLIVVEKLMKMNRPRLLCELFRACYMGLVDSLDSIGGQEELKWAAFTFLKLPQVLCKLQQHSPNQDFSSELEQGFDLLLDCVTMLDLADIRLNCDCLMFLLTECKKFDLLSEQVHNRLLQRRTSESQKPHTSDAPSTQPSASLIIRAEPTVTSILKTLDADYSKNQEALLGVLCHMLSGKSFELILAAAAATGKLQSFAIKLVKFNEFAKHGTGEGGKTAQTRALLFDISFLMLCHITQLYGTEIVTSRTECADSFFVQWALRCLPEDGKYKSVDISMPVDTNKVDYLLNLFTTGAELKQSSAKWHEICTNSPFAIQEVLFAWEHGALTADSIKMILNYVKTRMCCLPVVVSAWLCSYMNTLGEEARSKPLSMLQQLTQITSPDPATNQYYSERSHLMTIILKKMINDILPAPKRSILNQYIPPDALPSDVMSKTLKTVFNKGWVDMKSLHTLEQLVNLCGSDWFADRLVLHMLDSNRVEVLCQSLSLVFAICHVDLEHITYSLIMHSIPTILQSSNKMYMLTDPRGYNLAKLCALCITAAQTAKTTQKENNAAPYRRGRKRSRKEFDMEDMEDLDNRPVKRSKTMEPQITLDSDGFVFDFLNSKDEGETSPTIDTKDPLNKAIVNLFCLMNAIVQSGSVSPRTSFIISFIDETLRCGPKHCRAILQFMPPNMLSQVMKSIPGVFKSEHILHICDLSTSTGRKIAAKAVCQNSRYISD